MRALGLIVSQGETKHMPSALLRLTFNTIYKLLKNHISSETRAFEVFAMGCPRNLLYGRGLKVNTAAKALPISAARPDPGRGGYAWAAVLSFSPCPLTIFRGQPIG